MLITMEHVRAGGGCASGLRTFFNRYQLDLKAFLDNGGIDSDALLATGDAIALNIVRLAETRNQQSEVK
ncbi:hypothetical protein IG611_15255 [Pectobacterium sp. A535-S3-A17]|uniref:hypothetical protein n=1 Tax=Pectobacterium quasiaquaticum TaxID=2774015 RepID=UPI00187668D4|nr:hypothetical protein [Pectobacterium quasiaquaticum]MBE5226701.1 hypothetical protein [Pectobacterium quasiaquaticum]